jgi:NADH-quinone oxidoreductase subunit K
MIPTSIPLDYYLILSAVLFITGVIGVITRRNAIIIFMSIELMLNAVNLTMVAFSAFSGDIAGQIFVFFIMAVAAAEAAVGLAIVLALFRNKETVYVDEVNVMKW